MNKPDFVLEVIALAQQLGTLDAKAAGKFDAELRARYGGDRVRIAPTPPLTLGQVNAELTAGKPVRVIAGERGVSRTTVYRLIWGSKSRKASKMKQATP